MFYRAPHVLSNVVLALAIAVVSPALASDDLRVFDAPWIGYDAGDYWTARYLYAGAVADFDLDGDLDIAAASWPDFVSRVSVLLNNGNGTYAPPDIYALPKGAYDMIAADVSGDGYADIIASNTGTNYFGLSISVFINDGDGTFAPARFYNVNVDEGGPVGLAAADFDGDGDRDVAVANWGFMGSGTTVSLLLNDGDGTFAPPQHFAAGSAPFELTVGDFNDDGFPDLSVANARFNRSDPARVNVLMNDGTGGFEPPVQYEFFTGMLFFPAAAAADCDGDGDVDLVYSHSGLRRVGADGQVVAILDNNGDGTFAPARGIEVGGGGYIGIAMGDVTGDGWPDIVGTKGDNSSWGVVPSLGGGAFGAARDYLAAHIPWKVQLADVDADGDLDPVIVDRNSLQVTIHRNPGDGDFAPERPTAPIEWGSFFFDHGDIDGDGDLDIVSAASNIEISRNNGDGTFAPAEVWVPPVDPLDIKLGDLDGDDDLDIVFNHQGGGGWVTAMNDGTGHFTTGGLWGPANCGPFLFGEIDLYDLDGDGDLDVVYTEVIGCHRVFFNENLGDGTFVHRNTIEVYVGTRSLTGGDFNGDGLVDIAATSQPTSILINRGDFQFDLLPAAGVPGINIATDDFNGDGNLDLVIGIQPLYDFVESIAVQLGYGDGFFQRETIYVGSHDPHLAQIAEVITGDADGDGDVDIMAGNATSNDVSFWANNGDGTFERQVRYGAGDSVKDIALADFTGDGIPDLAVDISPLANGDRAIRVLPGLVGSGTPGDVNGDGVVDFADLLALLAAWGPCKGACPADLNDDGVVGFADLLILLANWS